MCIAAMLAANAAVAEPFCPEVPIETQVPKNPCGELPSDPSIVPTLTQETLPGEFIFGQFILHRRAASGAAATASEDARALLSREIRSALGTDQFRLHSLTVEDVFVLTMADVDDRASTVALMKRLIRMTDANGRRRFTVVEPMIKYYAQSNPVDEEFANGHQWGLARIEAPAAWNLLRSDDADVVLAVIDSGVKYTINSEGRTNTYDYGDLDGRLWRDPTLPGPDGQPGTGVGANWVADPATGDPFDEAGHGTEVAGIAGAKVDAVGIAGAAGPSDRVLLMPVKALAAEANPMMISGSTADIEQAIDYAIKHGASVINASFGTSSDSTEMCSKVLAARDAGVLIVAAAGNAGLPNDAIPFYPASYPFDNIISVMASTGAEAIYTNHSNHGCESVDIAAPGEDIPTPIRLGDHYLHDGGTSMAAPFVSAAAALVRSMNPAWSPAQVRQHLMDTVDKGGYTNASNGRLNMRRALTSPVEVMDSEPRTFAAGSTTVVKWHQITTSRACPTAYVRLLPHGHVATHDDCSDPATCLELASGIPVGNEQATVALPSLQTTDAYWRVGCDGSGFFSERGPFTID